MSDFAGGPMLTSLAVSFGVVLALFLLTWLLGIAVGRFNVVDTLWGLAFVAVAAVAFAVSGGHGDPVRRVAVLVVVAIWGVRLSAYIGWRSRGAGEDPRYAAMLDGGSGPRPVRALVVVFLPQAVICWFVSLPVQFAMVEHSPSGALLAAGLVVWSVGFAFEAGGDWQLARFRADPRNQGKVMDRGLWRYTRHPNYFGDACQWWGIYLVAAGQWQGAATVLSPSLMTYLLVARTGKKLLEKDIGDRRPDYRDYLLRTSGFLPRRPRH